ncbi:Protein of unknown function DUF262 [Mariprofundus ferrinatatus]|uniref:GmrSD restriction endonucleases N-terminal domain-containing protein n=1 Tax=Mariprofundus ferrinatatus TaxID=1921087 RepID=A0A2K8L309_9PROT|nr:DUF262 domain-containing protein [Mariprofundus ferrinatatus]ATX81725.1 Protein of unknown function DUF262 [Mariprofundus ferrinatatus]
MSFFKSDSLSLYDFFNISGVAYYIPFYQRQYSWDSDNVEKLMDDFYDGVKKICSQKRYLRFIGTIITLEEPNPLVHVHYDSNGLITKINNIIDGQQRISTLTVLSIIIHKRLKDISKEIQKNGWETLPGIDDLLTTIENKSYDLEQFYSIDIRKARVNPSKKPIVIRAHNTHTSPKTDQWTLHGASKDYYRSDIGQFLAHYIEHGDIISPISNVKLKGNVKVINEWIIKTEQSSNLPTPKILLEQNSKNLPGFIDGNIDLDVLQHADADCYQLTCGAMKLLALIYFMSHRTFLTVIECPGESLAFDMFQALNATGTPLTAIEVFKPLVVNTVGAAFGTSKTKEYFDISDRFFDQQKSAASKEKMTDEVLIRMALVHDSYELGKRFSDQRDWLTRAYTESNTQEQENLIHWMSDLTLYWENIFLPNRPSRNSVSFTISNHLTTLGLNNDDADFSALCIYYLKDAKHAMAHYLLSLFYSKLLRAIGTPNHQFEIQNFIEVSKACASFFTLWSAALSGFPDDVYRRLFDQSGANISWKTGAGNQNANFVKEHFKKALEDNGVFDVSNLGNAKNLWKSKAITRLGYTKKAVCRFSLFVASHDKAPDMAPGFEGLVEKGSVRSATYLNCESWFSERYGIMEHIGNREKPASNKYGGPDPLLYPGDNSVVDKIGNLTLWSPSANSSTYPEWQEKVLYYATLTRFNPVTTFVISDMAKALGVTTIPPSIATVAAASGYIANLAPIAYRGSKGLPWNKDFVDLRTNRTCELVFDDLVAWL